MIALHCKNRKRKKEGSGRQTASSLQKTVTGGTVVLYDFSEISGYQWSRWLIVRWEYYIGNLLWISAYRLHKLFLSSICMHLHSA